MNPPKFSEDDYISFLVASPRIFTCTKVERVQRGQKNAPCHHAVSRLLHRIRASALRKEALPFGTPESDKHIFNGDLVLALTA